MGSYEFVATCLFGLEKFVSEEIESLGYKKTDTIDGRVTFLGDESTFARFNVFSRYSERLYLKLGEFEAKTFTQLFDGTKELPFECFIGPNDTFPVVGSSIRSKLASIPDCQSIIKKAVVEKLKETYKVNWFEETGPVYKIEFFINKDIATIMLDTSGVALHKRGYRPVSNIAPLRETLAAAMVKISRPREDVLIWDPFCGSGTIAIEAAMMLTNTAPGANRKFAAENFEFLDQDVFIKARQEADDLRIKDSKIQVYASDIDPKCVSLTKSNARRAGVFDNVYSFNKNALEILKNDTKTTIICNPPYGERLMDKQSVAELYKQMGTTFSALAPWQIYIISSVPEFETLYGIKADKVRKFYNGKLKCNYYQYFKKRQYIE